MNWFKRLLHSLIDRPCPGCREVSTPFGRRCAFCDETDIPE